MSKHKLKFKHNDEVIVIEDRYSDTCSHGLEIGMVYTVNKVERESREEECAENHQEYFIRNKSGSAWVAEFEIKSVD